MYLINEFEQLFVTYPKLSAIALLFVGAIAKQLWDRFRKRIAVINWSATHMQHAASGDHPSVGQIRVTVNGAEARALYFTNVTVHNPTVRDFENLEIEFELPAGTSIVAADGRVSQDIRTLAWSDAFTADSHAARAVWAEQTPEAAVLRDKVSRWRAYQIPVLNRLATATFSFLWENSQAAQQVVNVGCVKAGVKMVYKKHPSALIFGVDQNQAALIGVFLALIIVIMLVPSTIAVWVAFILGISVKLVGIGAVKVWEFIVRTLS